MMRLRFWIESPRSISDMEQPHVVGRSSLGRTLDVGGKQLAGAAVVALRGPAEATGNHVLDHALPQRRDGGRVRPRAGSAAGASAPVAAHYPCPTRVKGGIRKHQSRASGDLRFLTVMLQRASRQLRANS
jgi:hypothetical protein